MTHLRVADWDRLANDVACSGCFYTHCSLMLPCLFALCFDLCIDLLFLRDEIVCVLPCLEAV